MAIVKKVEIDVSVVKAAGGLEAWKQQMINLDKEIHKTNQSTKELSNNLSGMQSGLKGLNSEQEVATTELKSYADESVNTSKIVAGLDKLTSGYVTKIIKVYKGFKESSKALGLFIGGLSKMQKALLATGIGALVVGVGLLIANWDKLTKAISGATAESKVYKEAQDKIISSVSKVQTEITKMKDAIELAEQGTISKESALEQYNKALGESVGYAESLEQAESLLVKNAATVIEVTRLKAQSEALYAKAAEARAKVIAGDESLDPNWWDTIKNATVSAFSGINAASTFATKQGLAQIENSQEAIKTAETLEGSAADLQTKIAELQKGLEKGSLSPKQREKRNKQIEDLEKKANEEAIQREKDKAAALESIRQALIDTEDERRNEELRKIKESYDEQIRLAEQYYGEESETVLALRQAQKDCFTMRNNNLILTHKMQMQLLQEQRKPKSSQMKKLS